MPSEKRNVITGGLILITLGVLIFVDKTTSFGFGQTWPILLIVIGVSTLIYRFRAIEGWFIAMAGVVFLIIGFYGFDVHQYTKFILPVLLILMGVYVILRKRKR